MESKKKTILYIVLGIVILAVGFFAGWLLRKNTTPAFPAPKVPLSALQMGRLPSYNSSSMVGNSLSISGLNAMQNVLSALQGKTGTAFDQAYLTQALTFENMSIQAARTAIGTSKNAAVIAVAKDIVAGGTKNVTAIQALQTPAK